MSQIKTDRIVSTPDVCGGKPCIAGTRIRVQDVYVWHELQGLSADEIASRFPQLSIADIYAALSYYWEHRDEMHRQMQDDTEFVDQLRQKNPSVLKQKLEAANAPHNPLPS